MSHGSPFLYYGFCFLIALVVATAVHIARRWGGLSPGRVLGAIGVWMVVSGSLAHAEILGRWELRPPPVMALAMVGVVGTVVLSRREWAKRIALQAPLWVLIGFHAYRLPLELIMHRAYGEGIMPIQMSFEGRNFDIATGIAAIVLGAWALKGSLPRGAVWAFNLLGLALLVNIVGIAIVSMPIFAMFGQDQLNVWITWVPYVWLPLIFVTFALLGHLLIFRRLLDSAPDRLD